MKDVYTLKRKDLPFLRSRVGKLLKSVNLKQIRRPVYAVGDRSIAELTLAGVGMKSIFYDNMVRRKATSRKVRAAIASFRARKLSVKNPPGVITEGLWRAAKSAVSAKRKVFVSGEEDLATVAVMLLARSGELVAYGLPKKGMALVKVSPKLKRLIRKKLGIG